MKRRKALSILLVAALTTAAAGCGGDSGGGSASSATAVEMRVQRQVGTVSMSNEKGEAVTLMEKMRLNAGHNLDTAKESYVMVSFDETKVMTLEENASASVVQNGNTLLFDVKKGNAFVNLTEELKGDQAVEVRSGNMVCGLAGTSIQIGKDADGNDTLLVTETDNPDGVSITVTDKNGNVTFQLDAKPGEKVVLQDDTGSVDKTNYDLEELSVTALYVIGQYPELVQKTAETFNVPEEHISTLSKLVSTEGENAGPLNGAAAEIMEKALKETKGVTGDALNAEQSILTNTRQLLDKVMAGEMTDEEKKNLLNTANEQMNTVVKAALDAGVQGEDLNNIAKNVAESITNVASTAIDQGKSVTEITDQTKTTGTNLGTVVTRNGNNAAAMAQAIEQIRNTTAPQPAPQPAQNPAPAQPQTPQAGNQNPQQQGGPAVSDDGGNDSGGTGGTGGNGNTGGTGTGGNTSPPPSSSAEPVAPQPSTPQPSTQEPSSTAEQGDSGTSGGSGGQQSGSQQSTPTPTTGSVTTTADGSIATLSDDTVLAYFDSEPEIGIESRVEILQSNTHLSLPLILTFPDGTTDRIESIRQIGVGSVEANGCVIIGVSDDAGAILTAISETDASTLTISNAFSTIEKTSNGTTITISPGDSGNIGELFSVMEYYRFSLETVTYGEIDMSYNNDNNKLTINDTTIVNNPSFSIPDDYLLINPANSEESSYKITPDGTFGSV